MTSRPKSLKIGWATWTVTYLPDKEWLEHPDTSEGNGGETHAANQRIFIRLEHPSGVCNETSLKEVLLHEILHAIFHTANLGYGVINLMKRSELEETIVGGMSGPLMAVMRDNPTFTRWLTEKS